MRGKLNFTQLINIKKKEVHQDRLGQGSSKMQQIQLSLQLS